MKVIRDDIWLCQGCTVAACNDDYTGFRTDAAIARTQAGLERLGPHLVPDFDSGSEEDDNGIEPFSRRGCDCCKSGLAGELHRFAILGEDNT